MLLVALPTLAATGLKGVVVDALTGKPIADANIMLRDQGAFVVTADDGTFTISEAKAGKDVLQIVAIKKKFGKNAILKGMNLEEGATAKDRNAQIGGHKA